MISAILAPKRRLSIVQLHASQMYLFATIFVLVTISIYASLDYFARPYYHDVILHEVRHVAKDLEEDIAASLIRQDFELAYRLIDQPKILSNARSKRLHVFSIDNFHSYSIRQHCRKTSLQSFDWGDACFEDGEITIEVPVRSADNILAHLQFVMRDNIWAWAPLRYAQLALAGLIILIGGLCFGLIGIFRKQFGEPLAGLGDAIRRAKCSEDLQNVIETIPVEELYDTVAKLIVEMKQLADANAAVKKAEVQRGLVQIGQQLDHAIKNRMRKVEALLAEQSVQRPALSQVVEAFGDCSRLIQEKLRAYEVSGTDKVSVVRVAPTDDKPIATNTATPTERIAPIGVIIRKVINAYRPILASARIEVIELIPKRAMSAFVHLDFDELDNVISNVIQNSIDALAILPARSERVIHVAVAVVDGQCEVSMWDSSSGFSEAVLQTLRSGQRITTKQCGNGVGTATIRELVQAAGGTVRFSNHSDGGAEVVIQLPLAATPEWYGDFWNRRVSEIVSLDDDLEIKGRLATLFPDAKIAHTTDEASFLKLTAEHPVALCLVDFDYNGPRNGIQLLCSASLRDRAVLLSGLISSDPELRRSADAAGLKMAPKEAIL